MTMTQENSNTDIPVLLIHGFLGKGESLYWGSGIDERRYVIVAKIGPASSLHDRAVELFYQLVGGTVDYGVAHSEEFGHDRFGVTFETAAYPKWSKEHPIDLVGHSLGGNTACALQALLHEKFFVGYDTDASWVRSICSISSPHHGTGLSNFLGQMEEEPGNVFAGSFGWGVSRLAHVYEYLNVNNLLSKYIFDLNLGHWGLAAVDRLQDTEEDTSVVGRLYSSTKKLASALFLNDSAVFNTKDNATYDLSIQGMREWHKRIKTHPCTYYYSFAASASWNFSSLSDFHFPSVYLNPILLPFSVMLGRFHASEEQIEKGINHTKWRENDGVAPKISQYHPHVCRHHDITDIQDSLFHLENVFDLTQPSAIEHYHNSESINNKSTKTFSESCHHSKIFSSHPIQKGVWMVTEVIADHIELVVMPRSQSVHQAFFREFYDKLDMLPR